MNNVNNATVYLHSTVISSTQVGDQNNQQGWVNGGDGTIQTTVLAGGNVTILNFSFSEVDGTINVIATVTQNAEADSKALREHTQSFVNSTINGEADSKALREYTQSFVNNVSKADAQTNVGVIGTTQSIKAILSVPIEVSTGRIECADIIQNKSKASVIVVDNYISNRALDIVKYKSKATFLIPSVTDRRYGVYYPLNGDKPLMVVGVYNNFPVFGIWERKFHNIETNIIKHKLHANLSIGLMQEPMHSFVRHSERTEVIIGRADSHSASNRLELELKAEVGFVSQELSIHNPVIHHINADIGAIDIQLTQTPTIVVAKYKQSVVPSITNNIEIPTDVNAAISGIADAMDLIGTKQDIINLKYNATAEPNEFMEVTQTVSELLRCVVDFIAEEITAYNEAKTKMETNGVIASKVSWCETEESIFEFLHSLGVQASEPQNTYSRDYVYASYGVHIEPNIFEEQNDLVSSIMIADIPSEAIMNYSEQHELVSSQIQSSYVIGQDNNIEKLINVNASISYIIEPNNFVDITQNVQTLTASVVSANNLVEKDATIIIKTKASTITIDNNVSYEDAVRSIGQVFIVGKLPEQIGDFYESVKVFSSSNIEPNEFTEGYNEIDYGVLTEVLVGVDSKHDAYNNISYNEQATVESNIYMDVHNDIYYKPSVHALPTIDINIETENVIKELLFASVEPNHMIYENTIARAFYKETIGVVINNIELANSVILSDHTANPVFKEPVVAENTEVITTMYNASYEPNIMITLTNNVTHEVLQTHEVGKSLEVSKEHTVLANIYGIIFADNFTENIDSIEATNKSTTVFGSMNEYNVDDNVIVYYQASVAPLIFTEMYNTVECDIKGTIGYVDNKPEIAIAVTGSYSAVVELGKMNDSELSQDLQSIMKSTVLRNDMFEVSNSINYTDGTSVKVHREAIADNVDSVDLTSGSVVIVGQSEKHSVSNSITYKDSNNIHYNSEPISITNTIGVYQNTNVIVGKAEQQHIENIVIHHINADVSVGADIQLTQTPTIVSVKMQLSNPWYSAYIVQENIGHTIKVFGATQVISFKEDTTTTNDVVKKYGNVVAVTSKSNELNNTNLINHTVYLNSIRFTAAVIEQNLVGTVKVNMSTSVQVSNPYDITLNKQSGTGGTSKITIINGFSITPTSSVTVPTYTQHNFLGYFTTAFTEEVQTVKLTVQSSSSALKRYAFEDNNQFGNPTKFLQVLYNSTKNWRLRYIIVSTTAVTSTDISDQGVTRTQVNVPGYAYAYVVDTPVTYAMANYTSGSNRYEFLDLVTSDHANAQVLDCIAYVSTTAKVQRITSTGLYVDIIDGTFSSATTLYAGWAHDKVKVLWTNYAGSVVKTEWIMKDGFSAETPSSSSAPTNTATTYKYTYSWPQSSYSISGDVVNGSTVVINEVRTTRTYTVTFYKPSSTSVADDSNPTYTATTVTYQADAIPSSSMVTLTDTQKYDYTPTGWTTTANPSYNTTPITLPAVTGNVVYYQTNSRVLKQYTVKWHANGVVLQTTTGGYGTTLTYSSGAPSLPPQATSYFSYARRGWIAGTADDLVGTASLVTSTLNMGVTVTGTTNYATSWTRTARTYVISYTLNGGSITGQATSYTAFYNRNSVYSVTVPNPTRTGYTFKGWTVTGSSSFYYIVSNDDMQHYTPLFDSVTSTELKLAITTSPSYGYGNITLTANWEANPYTVTFNRNGGGTPSPSSKTVTYNSTYGALATISRTGHTFNGWYTATSGGTKIETTTVFTGTSNQTLYARWTANTYTVTFNANGGGTPSPTSKSVTYGDKYGTLATISRTGHTFNGWYTAASGGTKIESTTTVSITAAQTLYAQWTIIKYTITWYRPSSTSIADDANFTWSSTTTQVNHGTTPTAPVYRVPTTTAKYSYAGAGWTTSSAIGYNGTTTTIPSATANASYYQVTNRTLRSYTITWESGIYTLATQTLSYGTTPTYPNSTPTKTETLYKTFVFSHWSPTIVAVTGNKTYEAIFNETVKTYTITVDMSELGLANRTYYYNAIEGIKTERTVSLGVYSLTNYKVSGWVVTVAPSAYTDYQGDISSYTPWVTINNSTLESVMGISTTSTNTEYYMYGNMTLKPSLTITDNTFKTNITSSFTLSYKVSRGTSVANLALVGTYSGSQTFTSLANYYYRVYDVVPSPGWSRTSSSTANMVNVTNSSGIITGQGDMSKGATREITAAYNTPLQYNISVTTNGGTGTGVSSVSGSDITTTTYKTRGSARTITMTPGTRTGYTFSGWTVSGANGKATVSGNTITLPAYANNNQVYGNLTITANWTVRTYTLTISRGTGVSTLTVTRTSSSHGTTGTLSNGATLYNGDKLTVSATASTGYNTPTITPGTSITVTGNITVSATTTGKSFDITLNPNGGTTASNNKISVVYNTSIEAYNNNMLPTRSSVYAFTGYYTTSSASGGTLRVSSSGYNSLTRTTYSAAATLYARWQQRVYLASSSGISNPSNLINGSDSSSSGFSRTTATLIFDSPTAASGGNMRVKSFYAEGEYIDSSAETTETTYLTGVYVRVYTKYDVNSSWSLYSNKLVYSNQDIYIPFNGGVQVKVEMDTGYGAATSMPYEWFYWSLVLGGIT